VDALNQSAGQAYVFPWFVDILVMIGFMCLFLVAAVSILKHNSLKRV